MLCIRKYGNIYSVPGCQLVRPIDYVKWANNSCLLGTTNDKTGTGVINIEGSKGEH